MKTLFNKRELIRASGCYALVPPTGDRSSSILMLMKKHWPKGRSYVTIEEIIDCPDVPIYDKKWFVLESSGLDLDQKDYVLLHLRHLRHLLHLRHINIRRAYWQISQKEYFRQYLLILKSVFEND